jgi:succinoglycan biosynthesis transport protein ExoP
MRDRFLGSYLIVTGALARPIRGLRMLSQYRILNNRMPSRCSTLTESGTLYRFDKGFVLDQIPQPNLPLHLQTAKPSANPTPAYWNETHFNRARMAETSGLTYYWAVLGRRKGVLIAIAFLGAMLGAAATLAQTRVYRAHASLELRDPNASGPEYVASDAFMQTQTRILQSQRIAKRVLDKMKAAGQLVPDHRGGRVATLTKALHLDSANAGDPDRFARELTESLTVRSAGQSRIVELAAESSSASAAADFLNVLTSEFIQQNQDATSQNITSSVAREVYEFRARLENSEERLRTFERQAGVSPATRTTTATQDKLRQTQQELAQAKADRIAKQTVYESIRDSAADSVPEGTADPGIQGTIVNLSQLKREFAELDTKFTPAHYRVVAVKERIAEVRAALEKQKAALLNQRRHDYDSALSREKSLSETSAAQERLLAGSSDREVQHNALKREVESNREIYERVLAKTKETTVPAALRAGPARIVDAATPPLAPIKPSMPQNVALGLAGGLILGMTLVVMREQSDRAIQMPGEASTYFNVAELGVIPSVAPKGGHRAAKSLSMRPMQTSVPSAETGWFADQAQFIISKESPAGFIESIRSSLLSIMYSGNGVDERRVLVLSSPNAGEGKTTLSANLAMGFAALNRRVLLIDGDLRRPRVHAIFGLPNEVGLSELLKGTATTDSGDVIHESMVKNLFILTSGGDSDDSTILVHENQLRELVNRLRSEFDTIIIDTPPLLQVADARVFGRLADALVLVIRAGKTKRDAVGACRARLSEDGIRLLGIILNDWDSRLSANKYYRPYTGSYGTYRREAGGT